MKRDEAQKMLADNLMDADYFIELMKQGVEIALNKEDAVKDAKKHYGQLTEITQDQDVLDTWFSSSLWPFTTMGWPENTKELEKYYPTSVLVTGFDIIFFWVARMMMLGMEFLNKEPFKEIYVHALVRDEKGQKMSKSKGNVIDPLVLIDSYSADAYFWSGELYLAQNSLQDARQYFLMVINRYANHSRIPDSLFKLGVISYKLNETQEALKYFNKVIELFPDSGSAQLAKKNLENLQK